MTNKKVTFNPTVAGEEKKESIPSHKFNEEEYMEVIQEEEKLRTPAIKNGRLVEALVPTGRVFDKKVLIKKYRNHRGKCQFRAAKKYEVSIAHLEQAYRLLNGKKIDGIYVTDLLDRLGFSDGFQLNTAILADKYGHRTKRPIVVAEDKLREIVSHTDIQKAYAAYMKDMKIEVEKVLRDNAVYGE